MKEQKGITIVAMIITIIVMVILAGVAITTAVLDGGVLQQAQNAQTEYEVGEELEKIKLVAAEAYLAGSGAIIEENLSTALDSNIGAGKYLLDSSNSEYFEVTIVGPGRKYNIYPNGKVEGPIKETDEGEDIIPPQTEMPVATVGIKVEENSTINGKMYSSTNPIIPAGFTAINVTIEGQVSSWDTEGGPEVDKGLVIRDDNNNEFVWVPVKQDINVDGYGLKTDGYREPGVITGEYNSARGSDYDAVVDNLIRAGCTEDLNDDGRLNAYDFEIQLTNEYKTMAESINKYDGFYVGRFETSKKGTEPQSKRSPGNIYDGGEIIETAYGSSTENGWHDLYALNKKYNTSSVQGSMIWGIQYDKMMSWMGDPANTTISGYNKERTCGTAPDDVINNVYDLYGNSFECTLEAYSSNCRVTRGGCVLDDYKPCNKGTINPSDGGGGTLIGSRMALYIK